MDRGASQVTVHGIAELDLTEQLHFLFFPLLHWQCGVLATGPPGKSHSWYDGW